MAIWSHRKLFILRLESSTMAQMPPFLAVAPTKFFPAILNLFLLLFCCKQHFRCCKLLKGRMPDNFFHFKLKQQIYHFKHPCSLSLSLSLSPPFLLWVSFILSQSLHLLSHFLSLSQVYPKPHKTQYLFLKFHTSVTRCRIKKEPKIFTKLSKSSPRWFLITKWCFT